MRVLGNKIFIRITKDNRESIYSKEITKDNGEKVRLFLNIPTSDESDARRSSLFVQTAIVEAVSDSVKDILKGDVAIIDYTVCNDSSRFIGKDGADEIYWIPALTEYHTDTLIAHKTRKSNRDQIVYVKGDYKELSPLLGVVRGQELIPNDPYIFLEHQSNVFQMVSAAGVLYSETKRIVSRKVLGVAKRTQTEYGIEKGEEIMVDDMDIFDITIDGLRIQAVCDKDVLMSVV